MRVTKTCPCKVNTSSPQNLSGRHFPNSRYALAAVYTDILPLCCSKFTQKVVPTLTQANSKVHVYSTVVTETFHHRHFSVQNHPCTEFRS